MMRSSEREGRIMVVVRDVFRIKFGQTKEATALWKEAMAALQKSGYGTQNIRLLSDLVGTAYYTIIMESTYGSLAEWEQAHLAAKTNTQWRSLYEKIIPLTEKGYREILNVVA
jgi:NIPSNAP